MWLRNTHARVAECTCSRVYTNVRGGLARASQTVQNPLHPKQRDHVISSHRRTPRKPKQQFKGGHRSISDYNHKQLYFCKTPRHNLGRQSKYTATGLATQRHRHAQSMYNATSLDTHTNPHTNHSNHREGPLELNQESTAPCGLHRPWCVSTGSTTRLLLFVEGGPSCTGR